MTVLVGGSANHLKRGAGGLNTDWLSWPSLSSTLVAAARYDTSAFRTLKSLYLHDKGRKCRGVNNFLQIPGQSTNESPAT